MEAPFAARINEAIDGKHLEEVIPRSAFSAVGQTRPPELAALEQVPELEGQPAGAPLARALEAELTQAHLHAVGGGVLREGTVGGKEGEGLGALRDGIESGDGAGPGGLLGVIDLAQIEEGPVEAAPVGDAAFFHERPVAVFLAVFAARVTFEIHTALSLSEPWGWWEWGRSTPRRFGARKPRKMGRFVGSAPRKESDPGAGCES